MTSPIQSKVQRRLSKRMSRDIKGSLKPKAEEIEPVQKNPSNYLGIGTSTPSHPSTVQRRLSKRISWYTKGKGKSEKVELVAKSLTGSTKVENSFSNTEIQDSTPSHPPTVRRSLSKRVSWCIKAKDTSEEADRRLAIGAETGDSTSDIYIATSAPAKLHHRFPMGISKDVKGKGKAEEDCSVQKPILFGNVEIEDYDEGYMTIRDVDKKSFVSYAHGQEVMRGDEWGFIHGPETPESSTSGGRYLQIKQSVTESARRLAMKAHLRSGKGPSKGKESEGPAIQDHNPRQVFGQKPRRLQSVLENSETLTGLMESFRKLSVFKRVKAPHRVWDRREEQGNYFSKIQYEEILKWNEDQIAEYNKHNLVALTTKQLKELQGKNADGIIYANPVYKVPQSSPATSQMDEEEWELQQAGEGAVWGTAEDEDPEAEHKYMHKDLRKLLGPYKGFHIAAGSSADNPEIFDSLNNFSDYYGLPFVEIGRNHKWEIIGLVNLVEQEYQRAGAEGGGDYGYENRDQDVDSNASSDYDQTQNVLYRPRSQLPGQALMIYLMYGGFGSELMPKLLAPLDEKFLYESESRWWKNFRIPQHTQVTEIIAEKMIAIAKAPKEWWEEECDPEWSLFAGKKIPKSMVVLQTRVRERQVKRFAVKAVENYLWWRFLGEQPHKEVKSGPMMRLGEY